MMKLRNILLVILVVMIAGGFFYWKKTSLSTEGFKTTNKNTLLVNSTSQEATAKDKNSFIEQLRLRKFNGGDITIEKKLPKKSNFTPYIISYRSDNLKIYAAMNIPDGNGPFPIILLNHGYYNIRTFKTGDGTNRMATILANNGYITLASDYRGHGESEGEGGGHQPEYAIDVLNLIASVKIIEKADATRIGMWGHSMGGETSLRTVEATDKIKALVLWAPTLGGGHTSDVDLMDNLKYTLAPVSLHQGLLDAEVDPKTSMTLLNSLEKENKQIEYFEYKGQDHNFQNLGWDLISERTINFFDKYLK